MIAYRSLDHELIKSVMTNPVIAKNICEDGQHISQFDSNLSSDVWVIVLDENTAICACSFLKVSSECYEVHINILPANRHERKAIIKILYKWIIDNLTQNKLTTKIPTCYPHIKLFCLSIGFEKEGVNRDSYIKNGELLSQDLFGITRDKIKEVLSWEAL